MDPADQVIHIKAPSTPDFAPQISAMGERLARLEERTESPHSDPAVAESLSLASAAHQTASAVAERVAALEKSAADRLADANAQASQVANEVSEVTPPAAIATPEVPLSDQPTENREPHPAWWNPARYL